MCTNIWNLISFMWSTSSILQKTILLISAALLLVIYTMRKLESSTVDELFSCITAPHDRALCLYTCVIKYQEQLFNDEN